MYYKEQKSKKESKQQKQMYVTTALCGFCSENDTAEIAVAAKKHPIVMAAFGPLLYCASGDGDAQQCSGLTRGQASSATG